MTRFSALLCACALLYPVVPAVAAAPPAVEGPAIPDSDLRPPPDPIDKAIKDALKEILPPLPPGSPEPSADPRNLEGAWFHAKPMAFEIETDIFGNQPPYTYRARKLLARRAQSMKKGTPYLNASALCRPPGITWVQGLNAPFQILQSPNRIEVLSQEYHGLQTIEMTPQKAPSPPTYMGTSVGRWDGNTLVVETRGFKLPLWIDVTGTPASVDAVITQRIRKIHEGDWYLEIVTTIDDPVYYTHPWSFARPFVWRPDKVIFDEYDCDAQIGDKSVNVNSGLVPEPPEGPSR